MWNRLKRAALSLGFVFATLFNNPRLAEKTLTTLTQDEFEPANEQERKQWRSWHHLERQFVRPDWVGKPRPTIRALMHKNMESEVKRRMEINGESRPKNIAN